MVETLFDKQVVPKSHRRDPQTSYDAAEKAAKTRRWWYQQVYSFLRHNDDPDLGKTAKEIASHISGKWEMSWDKAYYYVQRVLSEMARPGREWVFKREQGRESTGGGICCPWWAVFGKESEI